MGTYAQVLTRFRRKEHLVHSPFLPRLWIAPDLLGREAVKLLIVSWMYGYQLTLQMRRELGDLDAAFSANAFELIAIVFALCGLL